VDHPKELTHISLCAGYGGIDLGLRRALGAVRTVAFSEIESFAVENLVAKVEAGHLDPAPIWTDLKTFPWEQFRGRVDILSGGFPCQPFSAAGRRAGDDDPRHLWPHITAGIRSLGHPPIVFFENVEGIISSKLKGDGWADPAGTPVLLHVLRELERMGYEATAGVFSASEVGAPHQRKRVFIMGCRSDLSSEGRGIVDRLLRGTERGQELGNSQHNGQLATKIRGSDEAPSDRRTQREDSERESERASNSLQVLPTAYPAPRGAEQYPWEPPRVTVGNATGKGLEGSTGASVQGREPRSACTSVGNADREGLQRRNDEYPSRGADGRKDAYGHNTPTGSLSRGVQGQTQPAMGRDIDGVAGGLGYAELCHAVDNRTDELRLLGNGVVPATAERAFRVLWADLRD